MQPAHFLVALVALVAGCYAAQNRPASAPERTPAPPRVRETRPKSDASDKPGREPAARQATPRTDFWTRDTVPGAAPRTGNIAGVGCWNIEWFSLDAKNARNDADIDRMAGVIRQSGICVLGLNEIADSDALDALTKRLPGWRYQIGTTGRQQKCAILWDASRAEVGRAFEYPDINNGVEKGEGNLRAPLVAPVRVGKFDFLFAVVHLKAMFEPSDLAARRKQLGRLRTRLDEEGAARREPDVIVAGDFNDFADSVALKELTGRKGKSGYVITGARLGDKVSTYIPRSGRIDHVVITSPATSQSEWTGDAAVFPKPTGADRKLYLDTVSDHLPTWTTFKTDRDDD